MKRGFIAAAVFVVAIVCIIALRGLAHTATVQPQSVDGHADEIGRIATSNTGFTYTSDKYGFTFSYPAGWHVGDNHIGYGTFQLFNYDEATVSGKSVFPAGENKIEAAICDSLRGYTLDTDDYPDMTVRDTNLEVRGQRAIRSDVSFQAGQAARWYSIQLPNSEAVLCITEYGDPANLSVLDTLVQSLEFTAHTL